MDGEAGFPYHHHPIGLQGAPIRYTSYRVIIVVRYQNTVMGVTTSARVV